MRSTPEMLRVSQLRDLQLSLLTSLALGALAAVFSAQSAAQTKGELPATIPSLSGYDAETRQSIELACLTKKSAGPVTYGACLDRQIASLQGSSGVPSLSGYDAETRQSIELACLTKKSAGPVAYGACLNDQIASLQGSPATSEVRGADGETRQAIPTTARSDGTRASTSKSGVTATHTVSEKSRFTTENIMKVHQGMRSDKILEMFGAPRNVSQSVCGASVGKPWACATWEYGEFPYEWASFTFAVDGGSLILNSFDVHRE